MTPDQLATLKSTIDGDATLAAYRNAGQDTQIADALNLRTQPGPVLYSDFQPAMLQMPCWGKIRVFGSLMAPPAGMDLPTFQQVLGLCFVAIDLLRDFHGATIDTSLPAFQAAMNGLVATGLMSADERAAVLALANNQRSRAEVLFGVLVGQGDVSEALRGTR